jgi:hypothetical protein
MEYSVRRRSLKASMPGMPISARLFAVKQGNASGTPRLHSMRISAGRLSIVGFISTSGHQPWVRTRLRLPSWFQTLGARTRYSARTYCWDAATGVCVTSSAPNRRPYGALPAFDGKPWDPGLIPGDVKAPGSDPNRHRTSTRWSAIDTIRAPARST